MLDLGELLNEMERNSAMVTDTLNATFQQIYQHTVDSYPNLTLLSTAFISLACVIRYQFRKRPEKYLSAPNSQADLAGLTSLLEQLKAQQEALRAEVKGQNDAILDQLNQETAIVLRSLELFKTHAENQQIIFKKMDGLEQMGPTLTRVEDLIAKVDNWALDDKQPSQDNDEKSGMRPRLSHSS